MARPVPFTGLYSVVSLVSKVLLIQRCLEMIILGDPIGGLVKEIAASVQKIISGIFRIILLLNLALEHVHLGQNIFIFNVFEGEAIHLRLRFAMEPRVQGIVERVDARLEVVANV